MGLDKILKKIFSVTVAVAFVLQQGSFAFATNVDNWSDLRSYVASSSGDYYVTEPLTASDSYGTLNVAANGRTVTGYSLTENSSGDTLVNVNSGVTFGLGNNIYGGIINNGTLNYSGASLGSISLNRSVTGSGTLNLLSSSLTNYNTVSQSAVSVSGSTNLTNNGSISANTFSNSGAVDNNATITAAITNTGSGTLTSSATDLVGAVANNGTLNLEGGSVQAAITGTGNTHVTGNLTSNYDIIQNSISVSNDAVFANNGMLLASANVASGSSLNSDPDNLGEDVTNNGILNLNANGTLTVTVSGSNGTTNIQGDLNNQGVISQQDITVASGKVVTTNASDMTASNAITNDGIIHYTAGTTGNTINGSGRVDITGYVTNNGDITQDKVTNSGVFTNDGTVTANLINTNEIEGTGSITTGTGVSSNSGTIVQDSLTNNGTFDNNGHITLTGTSGTLTNNGTFNTNADLLTAAGGVVNDSALNITGGTNTNAITGGGTTSFTNNVSNNNTINQALVNNSGNLTNNALITADVVNSGTLTTDGTNVAGDVTNTGSYVITDGNNANDIIGAGGTTSILGTTTNTGTIMQETLKIANSGDLTTDSTLVTATITNDGKLTWNAGATNENVVNGTGELHINGADVVNSNTINQDSIKVISGSLTTNADLLTAANGITNSNDLIFNGGTNTNAINGSGDLTITDDVINKGAIRQGNLIINNGDFTTDADLIDAAITNNDGLYFTGGANDNDITGTGTTYIDGAVENTADISTEITVTTKGHYTTATAIAADLDNYGVTDVIDANINGDITGTGTTNILGISVNNASITQNNLNIASNAAFTTNSDDISAAVTNDGIMQWNAGTGNSNAISGAGELQINGADVVNTGAINQGTIKVIGGSLNSNADLLTSANGIINSDDLVFNGGTNTNAITGSGDLTITGDVINQGSINQGNLVISSGQLTTAADLLTTANGITNNSAISFTGGDNNNDITGTGTTFIDGTVQNLADVYTNVQVNTGAHYGTATDVQAKIDNRGITDLIDADILAGGKISGTGTTNILGDTVNNGSISQSALNIAAGGSLTTNSQSVEAAVTNDGTLTWNAGGFNANVVSGTGSLEITAGGTIANTAAISQNKITITSGALASNADLLASVGGIQNDATLGFSGGTNKNVITGSGNLTTANDVTNEADITQANVTVFSDSLTNSGTITADVTVNSGAVLTSNADAITGDITNDGTYAIADGDNDNDIDGTGALYIYGNTKNTGVIDQDTIHITTGATFIAADMDDVSTTSLIDNEGTLEMQSGTNSNMIAGTTGTLKVASTVTNASGATILQDNIDIATLGSFEAYASDLTTINGISNSGTLILNDGNNTNAISGTGDLAVIGTVGNYGNISQDTLTNTGTFTSDASLLAFADGITNTNVLNLTGGTNSNIITGAAGTTNFTNDVINEAAITQANVTNDTGTLTNNAAITADFANNGGTVNNEAIITGAITNTGTINSTADNLNGAVTNSNTLNLAGGTTQNVITGTGDTNITADLVNANIIAQNSVTNSANFTNSGLITADFNNSGVVDNTNTITGDITNSGTINSSADHLVGDIANTGTLNISGGTSTHGDITGAGDMNITGDLSVNNTIAQTNVTNTANLTVFNTITAADITNSGTITGKASDLVASNEIANDGTLVFNAASTGASDISGTGNVEVTANTTLTGTNTYTGTTLIDGADLTIAGQNNIGSDDVLFANNGLLVVTAAGSLDNNLLGNVATEDVLVQNDAALTLNGTIGAAVDFHKSGAGTMTLAMASNVYAGNTYVDAGTLVGNTGNINNVVNGAAGTTVEFNDTADADLNEINTLGTFVQSGSAKLNVASNAFSANVANINAGTFAANRALTANTLNVNTGAKLQGNGNITGNVNVNTGATIAPGNSIDTLTITGDLNLASGSTTAIEINETPASDKIVVTGATNIAGGANLTVTNENGRYFEWESFDILESAGNVTGTFTYDGTIAGYDTSRIDVEADYSDPTKVVLMAKRKATSHADVAGLSRNESEVARAVDAVSTGFGGDITNALLQLEELGGLNPTGVTLIDGSATLQSALANMDGVLYANSALATLFNAKTAHVYDRIAKRNPSAGKCPTCHDNVWAEYYSQYDKVYANANSPRFTNNMTGVLVGYDRSSEDVLLGVYGGAGKSDLRQRHDMMDIEDTSLGIYAGYRPGNWVFKGTLFGGYQTYHGKRSIDFMARSAEGRYHGMNLALDLEGGYNAALYDWLNLKPFVGVLGNYAHLKSFTETGADALNLHVESKNQFNTQARLGVQLEGKVGKKFNWYGSAAVKQFIGGDYAKLHMSLGLPGTRMEIISAELGRTYFSGQVGVSYALTNHWTVFGNLDAGVNNKSTNCYGNVGLAYTW